MQSLPPELMGTPLYVDQKVYEELLEVLGELKSPALIFNCGKSSFIKVIMMVVFCCFFLVRESTFTSICCISRLQ